MTCSAYVGRKLNSCCVGAWLDKLRKNRWDALRKGGAEAPPLPRAEFSFSATSKAAP